MTYTLCTSKDMDEPCTYTEDFVRQHTNISNIIYCSDDQRPENTKTFKNVDRHDFNIQLALMSLSDYHFGNPQSTIDYVLTYMRKKNKMYPENCYSIGPFVKAPSTLATLKGFVNPFSGGGMSEKEQEFLLQSYKQSHSVFEWGMGSSSALANYVGVDTLVSVDSPNGRN